VHGNPRVRTVVERRLAGTPRIHLVDPLPYPELLEVLRRAVLVLTDSGGIQEEVAALRKPVLILREVTERPEVVEAGFGELVGTNPTVIMRRTALLLHDPTLLRARCAAPNPFGDGRAGERIAEALAARLGAGDARRLPRRLGGDQLEAALTRFREVA
jgi:UDP-N-acetylglucosamine 2-epimerase (non-hydrolysing)